MIRVTQLKLPLGHPPEALKAALAKKLKLSVFEIQDFQIFKRAHDARSRTAILYIYTLDVTVKDEAAVLARFARDLDIKPAPDMTYQFVARAPATFERPLVIGAGPCGLFAALILAQSGFKPILLERGKAAGDRARDVTGFWRETYNPSVLFLADIFLTKLNRFHHTRTRVGT